MNDLYRFEGDIYDTMLDNDEVWFCNEHGTAMLISDCALLDC
jgi:hypothetical protein